MSLVRKVRIDAGTYYLQCPPLQPLNDLCLAPRHTRDVRVEGASKADREPLTLCSTALFRDDNFIATHVV